MVGSKVMVERKGFEHQGITWIIDPNGRFSNVTPQQVIQMLGLIPQFFHDEMQDVISDACGSYGFCGAHNDMKGGRVTNAGTYLYPGDPALDPLAVAHIPKNEYNQWDFNVFVYEYGIITFFNVPTGEYKTYRFD